MAIDYWIEDRLDLYIEFHDWGKVLLDYNDYMYWRGWPYIKRFEYVCIISLLMEFTYYDSVKDYKDFVELCRPEIRNGNKNIIKALKHFSLYMFRYGFCNKNYMKLALKELKNVDYIGLYPTYRPLKWPSEIEYYYYELECKLKGIDV